MNSHHKNKKKGSKTSVTNGKAIQKTATPLLDGLQQQNARLQYRRRSISLTSEDDRSANGQPSFLKSANQQQLLLGFSRKKEVTAHCKSSASSDHDKTPVVKRKSTLKHNNNSRPSSMVINKHDIDELDKMADEIIDSVRQLEVRTQTSNDNGTQSSKLVRRSSSGYSTSSNISLKSADSNHGQQEKSSSRLSFSGLLRRTSTHYSSGSPVQSRIAKKMDHSSSAVSGTNNPASNEKRNQFTQVRSKTGLNIFSGRRRSIAITDDAYNALAIRAAKSHLDLNSLDSNSASNSRKTTAPAG